MKKSTKKENDEVTRIYVKELVEADYLDELDKIFALSGYNRVDYLEIPNEFNGTIVRAKYRKDNESRSK
jgi:hypothetical protein